MERISLPPPPLSNRPKEKRRAAYVLSFLAACLGLSEIKTSYLALALGVFLGVPLLTLGLMRLVSTQQDNTATLSASSAGASAAGQGLFGRLRGFFSAMPGRRAPAGDVSWQTRAPETRAGGGQAGGVKDGPTVDPARGGLGPNGPFLAPHGEDGAAPGAASSRPTSLTREAGAPGQNPGPAGAFAGGGPLDGAQGQAKPPAAGGVQKDLVAPPMLAPVFVEADHGCPPGTWSSPGNRGCFRSQSDCQAGGALDCGSALSGASAAPGGLGPGGLATNVDGAVCPPGSSAIGGRCVAGGGGGGGGALDPATPQQLAAAAASDSSAEQALQAGQAEAAQGQQMVSSGNNEIASGNSQIANGNGQIATGAAEIGAGVLVTVAGIALGAPVLAAAGIAITVIGAATTAQGVQAVNAGNQQVAQGTATAATGQATASNGLAMEQNAYASLEKGPLIKQSGGHGP